MHFWFCCDSPKANPERWTQVKLCCPVDSRDSPAKSRVQTGECLRTSISMTQLEILTLFAAKSLPWAHLSLCLWPFPKHCQQLHAKQLRDIIKNTWESLCCWHAEKQATILGVQALPHTQHIHTARAGAWGALSPSPLPPCFLPWWSSVSACSWQNSQYSPLSVSVTAPQENKKRFRDRLIPVPVRYYISKPNADFEHYLEGWG